MDYHVSTTGNDSHSGTPDHPFHTIQKAANVMRPGDTCFVRGGTYRETVRVRTGGTEEAPIRFAAFPGEVVVIDGTERIEGEWRPYEGSIYQTSVDWPFSQLFVDRAMMIEARWPNARFDQLLDRDRWAETAEGSRYGRVVDPGLARTGIDWTGATATLNVAHQFFTWTRTVRSHTPGSEAFEYDRDLPGITHHADKTKPWEHNRYYLSGKLGALDCPTEWFLDETAGSLYLWAPDGRDPSSHTVEAKARDYGFDVEDVSHVEIEGFHFFGCTFRFVDSHHCKVESCHLRFPNYTARITEMDADRRESPKTSVEGTHNTVRDCSLAYSPTSGISIHGSHSVIENCLVHDVCWNGSLTYAGIRLEPERDSQAPEGGSIARRNTVFDAGNVCLIVNRMPNNIVEYNHLSRGGRACKDVSLLYTHLPLIDGTVMRYNWVHDCHTEHIALGIRGDDQTRGLTLHHNVVWNCDWDGIVVKGENNRIYHNTCLNNGQLDILIFNTPEPLKPWREQWPLLEEQNRNTETYNNCAQKIRGSRGRKVIPPGGDATSNYEGSEPRLRDPDNLDFRPKGDSPLCGAGREIPGFTGDCEGGAPDIGAYDHRAEPWTAGYQNRFWTSTPEIRVADGKDAKLKVALTMPPLETVVVTVAVEGSGLQVAPEGPFELTPEAWMEPRTLAIGLDGETDASGGRAGVRLHAEGVEDLFVPVIVA